jgi:hypothetical protein
MRLNLLGTINFLSSDIISQIAISQIKSILLYLRRVTEINYEDWLRPGLDPRSKTGIAA